MNVQEFSNEFDILFNGIASNSAPPIDSYEKSVYLTKAQLELVNSYFNPLGNKYKAGFEGSNKRRSDLTELIRGHTATLQVASNNGLDGSTFFRIPNDVYFILQEEAEFTTYEKCLVGKKIKIKPITHDEYNLQKDNPFKKPDQTVIWRLDYYSQSGNNKNVELVSHLPIKEYSLRYIKYPDPIVLVDLDTQFPGESLSVDGINTTTECKLSEALHKEILTRAVELATADYKPEEVSTKVQINQRNE